MIQVGIEHEIEPQNDASAYSLPDSKKVCSPCEYRKSRCIHDQEILFLIVVRCNVHTAPKNVVT
jgi:hypothetical protein